MVEDNREPQVKTEQQRARLSHWCGGSLSDGLHGSGVNALVCGLDLETQDEFLEMMGCHC